MAILNALAGVAVRNFAPMLSWYEELLDRGPDTQPMEGLAEWRFDRGGWLQLFVDAERAGSSSVTLAVASLEDVLAALERKSIEVEGTTESALVKTAAVIDPEGNRVVFAQALAGGVAG